MAAIGALLASLAGTACSPANLLSALSLPAPGGEYRDIQYAQGPRQAMDLYAPSPGASPAPVVVFFYGGGWTSGERADYRFLGRGLAACGALVAIPDYRVWPEVGFPEFLRDGAAAVARMRRIAARYGGDPGRLILMGHSAGAYIAAMLALDPTWLAGAEPAGSDAIAAVVGISGPYDFLPLRDPVLQRIFGDSGARSQPISFARADAPPMLLQAGGEDTTVDPGNSLRLAARIRSLGGRADAIIYPAIGHAPALGAYAWPLRFLGPLRADACDFIGLHASARRIASRAVAHPDDAARIAAPGR